MVWRSIYGGESIYLEEQPIRHPRIFPNWMCCETEPAAASDHFPLSKGKNVERPEGTEKDVKMSNDQKAPRKM